MTVKGDTRFQGSSVKSEGWGGAWSPNHFLPPLDYERVVTSLQRCNLRIAFRSFCENAHEFKRVDLS